MLATVSAASAAFVRRTATATTTTTTTTTTATATMATTMTRRRLLSSSAADSDEVLITRPTASSGGGGVRVLLNRPRALNALSLAMIRKLVPFVAADVRTPTTSCVVSRGAGAKAYCAGGDVVSIYRAATSADAAARAVSRAFFAEEYVLDEAMSATSLCVPHVALLDGIVMGGGVGLSVHGAFRVATRRTLFAMPETGIGFFPDVGGSHFLSRLPDDSASTTLGRYLALTGARLKGADVVAAGVATHYLGDDDDADADADAVDALEAALLALPPATNAADAHAAVARVLREHGARTRDQLPPLDPTLRARAAELFAGDSVRAIVRNVADAAAADADDTFASTAHAALCAASPLALAVTFEQLRRGGAQSLRECLAMEYHMTQVSMDVERGDFCEGVRALLVDKDKQPRYHHRSIDDVDDADVAAFFPADRREHLDGVAEWIDTSGAANKL